MDDSASSDETRSDDAEVGGHFARGPKPHTPIKESGLTALKEQRMLHRAIREGWIKEGRWPTEATPSDLQKRQQERGELTLKEQAAASAALDMPLSLDDVPVPANDPEAASAIKLAYRRLRQMTVRNVVAMERQYQADDLMALRLQADGQNAQAFSAATLEAIVSQCVQAVAEVVGPEQAPLVRDNITERLAVEGPRRGTTWTPDQYVRAMSDTIGAPPVES